MCHDKHQLDHHFQVRDQVWIYISKERMKGEGKNLKPIRYGPFEIVENFGHNALQLNFLPYIHIYSVVWMDRKENDQIPIVDVFSLEYMTDL